MYELIKKFTTHTSGGILSKALYFHNGKKYLVKGNTPFGNEPYSEVMGCIVAEEMGLETVKYFLEDKNVFNNIVDCTNNHVSVCELLPYKITKYADFFNNFYRKVYTVKKRKELITSVDFYIEEELSIEHLIKMLLLDAFIGNKDRHFNNFDVYVNENKEFKNAPILDYGLSLLSFVNEDNLDSVFNSSTVGIDISQPFKRTHNEQINFLKEKFNDISVLEIDNPETFLDRIFDRFEKEVFPYLSEKRAKAIKKYLKARYPVYIEPYIKKEQKETINWE